MRRGDIIWITVLYLCVSSAQDTYVFDDSKGQGRKFDGIGGLSGGGATSKLLVNYPEKQRNEILDFLFKPNFGAALHILKVEIGGDIQSTDGTEACHMHNSWDENYHRGYEWWLMLEAKKRNPDIQLYGLAWGFPGWVGQGTNDPYHNVNLTGDYIVRWINGAKQVYNLTIDFIGIWNERRYDINFIKTLRHMLDDRGFSHTRIVASDNGWEIARDIQNDPALSAAVDYIGCHYPGTTSSRQAFDTGKQLWASEDYSTYNDETGGGCWARILNKNYVEGYMTSTISWNLIASYYNQLPYFRDGLMTAIEPWSGNYDVETPIWLSAHTTQFTQIGWTYLSHGAGVGYLKRGGSYVSLMSPDKKDFTIIIETMSHDHSICIRPRLPWFDVQPQNITIILNGSFSGISKMNVWYSKLGFDSAPTVMFQNLPSLTPINGQIVLDLGVDEMYTLTTINTGQKGQFDPPPPSQPFPLPYSDNFDGYDVSEEPFNLAQQIGSFEIVDSMTSHGKVLRQMVLDPPIAWCNAENVIATLNIIGDYNWTDIQIAVNASLGKVNRTEGVFVAVRVQSLGCEANQANGLFFFLFPDAQMYLVTYDLARTQVVSTGRLASRLPGWNLISLNIKGTYVQCSVNGILVFRGNAPNVVKNGFVGFGTDTFGIADFDNLNIISLTKKRPAKNSLYFVSEGKGLN